MSDFSVRARAGTHTHTHTHTHTAYLVQHRTRLRIPSVGADTRKTSAMVPTRIDIKFDSPTTQLASGAGSRRRE